MPEQSAPVLKWRPATGTDVDAVVALVESAYRGDASRAGWTTEADLLDGQRTDAAEVSALVARQQSLVLVGELDGRMTACCHLERRDPDVAYFGLFAVRPTAQGSGIGRALMAEAFRIAAGWGCRQMRMTVIRQRSDLIAWYQRLGFGPTGQTEPFPYGDERFGQPRRQDLEFVVLASAIPGAETVTIRP